MIYKNIVYLTIGRINELLTKPGGLYDKRIIAMYNEIERMLEKGRKIFNKKQEGIIKGIIDSERKSVMESKGYLMERAMLEIEKNIEAYRAYLDESNKMYKKYFGIGLPCIEECTCERNHETFMSK